MIDTVKSFVSSAVTTLVVILSTAAIATWILPLLVGARPVTVLSDSMKPTFSAGDVIWVDTSSQNVGLGDVIMYHPEAYNNERITHRVISVNTGTEKHYVTQGDANSAPDEPIIEDQIIGVVKPPLSFLGLDYSLMSIPFMGYLQKYFLYIGIVILVLVLGSSILTSRAEKKAEREAKKRENEKTADDGTQTPKE